MMAALPGSPVHDTQMFIKSGYLSARPFGGEALGARFKESLNTAQIVVFSLLFCTILSLL